MNNISKKAKVELTLKTAYLTGVIIGDGNLSGSLKSKNKPFVDYRITIDISDKDYLLYLEKLIKTLIQTKTCAKEPKRRVNRIPRLYLQIRNKELFTFLNNEMEIPKGKKSDKVYVPPLIKYSTMDLKKWFLTGYFDTDGGFRGNSLGFTTGSLNLNEGVSQILNEFDIRNRKEEWLNKKYNKTFYGIRIYKTEIDKFLNTFHLQNKEKLERIRKRFHVEAA
jgi:intein/homing endonuclease